MEADVEGWMQWSERTERTDNQVKQLTDLGLEPKTLCGHLEEVRDDV
jgi:hypothetical protein